MLNLVKIHSGILNLLYTDKWMEMIKLMDTFSHFMMHFKQIHFLKIKVLYAVMPCRLVNIYRRFGWSIDLNPWQQRCEEPKFRQYTTFPKKHSWPLKMGPIGFPEMSVRIYHYLLCNSPEEGNSLKTDFVWRCFILGKFVPVPHTKA